MPPLPFAHLRERHRRRRAAAVGQLSARPQPRVRRASGDESGIPAEWMSIPRLAGLILLVEVVNVSALAFAVPRGTGAVALAFVATFLLATVISRRVGRCQPTSTNLKTREQQRPVPSVTRQRRTGSREERSHAHDPQES